MLNLTLFFLFILHLKCNKFIILFFEPALVVSNLTCLDIGLDPHSIVEYLYASNIAIISGLSDAKPGEPKTLILYSNIMSKTTQSKIRLELTGKSGIYSFINNVDGKRYIGSAKDLHKRFMLHLKGKDSNVRLQRAFNKHGRNNFSFVIYAFADYSLPAIMDLETLFITYFKREKLYNLKFHATTMLGYKHREDTKKLISKPGKLNPMYGKSHLDSTKRLISDKIGNPVTLYNKNGEYVLTFKNNVHLSRFLNCEKSTIGLYIKTGNLFKELYYIKKDIQVKRISTHSKAIRLDLYDENKNYLQTFNSQRDLSLFLKCDKTTVASYMKSGKLYKKLYYIKKKE